MNNNVVLNEYKLNRFISLKNRIVMAPMTRAKADNNLVPTEAMAEYYERRADAGLIVTEGTVICLDALGYSNVPGIFSDAQIKKWKEVTNKVHRHGGLIFMQIWHTGRVSHPFFLQGKLPISASETVMKNTIPRSNGLVYGKSRAVSRDEIKQLIDDYATAAKNARKADFDGIEIHGANGYLIDQFLHYHTNLREDEYGGNSENMARFALEVVEACGEMIGYERVGLRLSPGAYLNEIVGDRRDAEVFKYLLNQLNTIPIAYVHTGNFDDSKKFLELDNMTMTNFIRSHYKGTVIACGGYTIEKAQASIGKNEFDLVAIGKPFIANPDFINKIKKNEVIQNYDVTMLNNLY